MKIVLSLIFIMVSLNSYAGVLSKTAISIKKDFDAEGATSCSQYMAETYDFITKGASTHFNKSWSNIDPNKRAIVIDFAIVGTKTNYSKTGSIILIPAENTCRGMYTYQQTISTKKCAVALKEEGFEEPEWITEKKESNGDGGEFTILALNKSPGLFFNFNDVPGGGCVINKRETISSKF